jgi:hypothetical protein
MLIKTLDDIQNLFILFNVQIIEFEQEIQLLEKFITQYKLKYFSTQIST